VLIAAWLLELTPDGFKLQKTVEPGNSIARKTGRQLNRGIIMILAISWNWPEAGGNHTNARTTEQTYFVKKGRTSAKYGEMIYV